MSRIALVLLTTVFLGRSLYADELPAGAEERLKDYFEVEFGKGPIKDNLAPLVEKADSIARLVVVERDRQSYARLQALKDYINAEEFEAIRGDAAFVLKVRLLNDLCDQYLEVYNSELAKQIRGRKLAFAAGGAVAGIGIGAYLFRGLLKGPDFQPILGAVYLIGFTGATTVVGTIAGGIYAHQFAGLDQKPYLQFLPEALDGNASQSIQVDDQILQALEKYLNNEASAESFVDFIFDEDDPNQFLNNWAQTVAFLEQDASLTAAGSEEEMTRTLIRVMELEEELRQRIAEFNEGVEKHLFYERVGSAAGGAVVGAGLGVLTAKYALGSGSSLPFFGAVFGMFGTALGYLILPAVIPSPDYVSTDDYKDIFLESILD
jgi:hypothetical protein